MNKIFHIGSTFKAFEEGNDLHIAGMASTSSQDRMGDVIEAAAWTKGGLDNYLNNPVILFNHDYNQPIGRAVQLGTNDNGLQLKAKIAKSAGHVGELIKEGVLGAFSVGFRVKDAEYMVETDGYRIKDAELLEVSVVTVPANQAATFSLAKSFDSDRDYEEFKKSFKQDSSLENTQETVENSNELMPNDLSKVEEQEKSMDIDIEKIVAAAVEKTATAMAMKEAERKAEEQRKLEAEKQAVEQKAAEEARIVTAVQSGAEKLLADIEEKLAAKDADYSKIIGELQGELKEKADEIEKIRQSKRVFSDRTSGEKAYTEEDAVNAHILGVVTTKGMDTRLGRALLEKAVNTDGGVSVPSSTAENFESTVSTAIERDIELELVIDPLFRKIQMSAASMVVPIMPDSGYAEFVTGAGAGTVNGNKGNLEARDDVSPNSGIDLTSKILTAKKLASNSYLANEVEEDAIIPILPLIREAMVRSHARAIEQSLLMGGHSDALLAGSYDGLVERARDASKNLDVGSPGTDLGETAANLLLEMRQAMGKYGRRPGDVVYIVSLDCYYDLLADPDFQNINEVGDQRATKITGEIGNLWGSPVIVSDEFPTKAAGKAFAVAVNPRNFVIPVLRGVTVEQDYEVSNQRRVLVATQRRGFDCMIGNGAGGQVVTYSY